MSTEQQQSELDDIFARVGGVEYDSAEERAQESARIADGLPPGHTVNPLTGLIVDTNDIDSLITELADVKSQIDQLNGFNRLLRQIAADKTTGTAKARRIQGKERIALVTFPKETWDQAVLKEAYHSYPKIRDTYLRISEVGVIAKEFKKLKETTTDDQALNQFKGMITRAYREPQGIPSVKVEK